MEIYPGSVCSLVGNGIHHCKDGVLIKVRNLKNDMFQKQKLLFVFEEFVNHIRNLSYCRK